MPHAKEYERRVSTLAISKLHVDISSVEDAKSLLKAIRADEKSARLIKREVTAEQKQIREHYRDRKANAGTGGSFVLSAFGKRGAAGQYRASVKRDLQRACESDLRPYNAVKSTIDDLLVQTARAKAELESYIEQNKPAPAAGSSSATRSGAFCHQCGDKIARSDKFCRHCGEKQ